MPTALLHGDGRLLQGGEDARDRVFDGPHDEAVEEGDIALGADTGLDAPARQELEVLKHSVEVFGPEGLGVPGFHGGKRSRHAPPGLGDRALLAIAVTMAILGAPDMMRDVGTRHLRWSRRIGPGVAGRAEDRATASAAAPHCCTPGNEPCAGRCLDVRQCQEARAA